MANEPDYSSPDTNNNSTTGGSKRKYDEPTTTPPSGNRTRPTGFSSGPTISDDSGADAPPPPSYNSVPPPTDEISVYKQRAQEIAERLMSGAAAVDGNAVDSKRPRVENGGFDSEKGFSSAPPDMKPMPIPSASSVSYGSFQGSTKRIDIPNNRVGVIIGKGGETIKYLQLQSGSKIQVTRDTETDPGSTNRAVELTGTPEQIAKAEQLINDVLTEAEAGGPGTISRRLTTGDHFSMKIPNNKVGLVIGKGGETIKNFQARTGARIQVIPLHLPPGDTSLERTVQIEGTREQIDYAKQLVDEVTSEAEAGLQQSNSIISPSTNRSSNPANSGGYSQQGYQTRPASGWARGGASQMTQPNYGYVQQPQYSQPQYGGYPPQQASGGYPSGGYDYYGQQQQSSQTPTAAPGDNTGYNYNQAPASGYNQQGQAYSQDGYGAYYAAQSGYGQPTPYDQQQQSYSSAAPQDGQAPSYGTQGESAQAIQAQQGYGTNQQPASDPQGSTGTLSGYGIPPTSQSGYQAPAQSGYATAGGYGQKPPANPTAYGQTQQSPSNPSGYSQPGYAPSGYNNATTAQQGYGPASYGAGYGQQPQAYSAASYGSGYPQPAAYSADGTAHDAAAPTSQSGLAKESPQS